MGLDRIDDLLCRWGVWARRDGSISALQAKCITGEIMRRKMQEIVRDNPNAYLEEATDDEALRTERWVAKLEPRQKKLVRWRYVGGCSYQEISERLKCSKSTAHDRVQNVLAYLEAMGM